MTKVNAEQYLGRALTEGGEIGTVLIGRPSERRDKIPREEVYSCPFDPAARAELLAALDEDVLTLPPSP